MSDDYGYGASHPSPANEPAFVRPASLSIIIGRIEDAVDEETTGLKAGGAFDLSASNARKTRCLYELSRAIKGLRDTDVLRENKAGLNRLRDKLARNETVLRAHMTAVTEVAALMQNAIRKSETDGTYSATGYGDGF